MKTLFQYAKKIRDLYLKNLKWRKYKIGNNFHAGRGVIMWAKNVINIGNNFYIGRYSSIECDSIIGDNVLISNFVALVGKYDHHYQNVGIPIRLSPTIRDKQYDWKGNNSIVIIEDDVWIGFGSIIISGVKIATGSIISAGSVVTKDTEPYSINAGVPAKKIRDRFNSEIEKENHIKISRKQTRNILSSSEINTYYNNLF